jgi:hypothetical protein
MYCFCSYFCYTTSVKQIKLIALDGTQQGTTLVDDDIYNGYKHLRWRKNSRGYAMSYSKNMGIVLLHRLILGAQKGTYVDHTNHDILDNRRENIRLCTQSDNQHNRLPNKNNKTGYPGVSKFRDKYRVFCNGAYLGLFDTPEQGSVAYMQVFDKF